MPTQYDKEQDVKISNLEKPDKHQDDNRGNYRSITMGSKSFITLGSFNSVLVGNSADVSVGPSESFKLAVSLDVKFSAYESLNLAAKLEQTFGVKCDINYGITKEYNGVDKTEVVLNSNMKISNRKIDASSKNITASHHKLDLVRDGKVVKIGYDWNTNAPSSTDWWGDKDDLKIALAGSTQQYQTVVSEVDINGTEKKLVLGNEIKQVTYDLDYTSKSGDLIFLSEKSNIFIAAKKRIEIRADELVIKTNKQIEVKDKVITTIRNQNVQSAKITIFQ